MEVRSINDIDGLTYDVTNSILWASNRSGSGQDGDDDYIFQINPTTGMPVLNAFGAGVDYLIIDTPEDDLDDIAMHPNGTLYGISNNGGTGNQRLIIINTPAGTYTNVGDYGLEDVEGLTFTNGNQMMATTGDGGDNDDEIHSIDAATANSTFIAHFATAIDVEACACRHSNFVNNTIGNFVWGDIDEDGIQDPGEPGIPNVQVRLLDNSGNPVLDGGSPVITITDVTGKYSFPSLANGSYMIEVTAPFGTSFSTQDAGSDDELDSDVNTSTGRTGIVSVSGGIIINHLDIGLLDAVETRTCNDDGELFVANGTGAIFRFNPTTGALKDKEFITGLSDPMEMIANDNVLYVTQENSDKISSYSLLTGSFISDIATGMDNPNGMTIGPDGNLYVNNRGDDEVQYYNITTGAFLGNFVTSGLGGLDGNYGGIEFGSDGNLYVTSAFTDEVLRYNGTTGAFINAFVSAGSGGLDNPRDLTFGSDGHLYVVSKATEKILRYNGSTGAFIDEFVDNSSSILDEPVHLIFGDDGDLYVSEDDSPEEVIKFNGTTGAYISTFTSGLTNPTGMLFAPVPGCECEEGVDSDLDGIKDICDDDDDNDGILDVDECPTPTSSGLTGPLTGFTTSISTTNSSSAFVSHNLNSITYGGTTYTDFIVPDSYTSAFTLTTPSDVHPLENGIEAFTYASNLNYDQDILKAFQSRNLNNYQDLGSAGSNNFSNGDYYDLNYNNPIVSTVGGFLAVTERNGNNPQYVQALDEKGNIIGSTISVAVSDYVDLGVNVYVPHTQNAHMALYPVDNLAPVGTKIYGIRISFGTVAPADSDGPDAKAFFFGNNALFVCDYDGDGIPNDLDLDSDNDGCPDALEGGGSFDYTDVDNNTALTGGVDANGIPTVAGAGQTVGSSQNENTQAAECSSCDPSHPDFVDSDGDSYGNACDQDDDNDGILDIDEFNDCFDITMNNGAVVTGDDTEFIYSNNISSTFQADMIDANAPIVSATVLTTGTGISSLTHNAAPSIMNVFGISSANLYQAKANNDYIELSFTTIDDIENGVLDGIRHFKVNNFGSAVGTNTVVSMSFEISSDGGSTFTNIANFMDESSNTTSSWPADVSVDNSPNYTIKSNTTYIVRVYIYGLDNGTDVSIDDLAFGFDYCLSKDTDNDGTPNHLDLDSDNDGCPDAIEGGGSFTTADLTNNRLTGGVGIDGIPNVAGSGQTIGSSQDVNISVCLEICNNGIDDDGDGLVDEFDPDCPCTTSDFFFGDCTPTCDYVPPSGSSNFDLTNEWTATANIMDISQLFVADMDGEADGVSEIITMKSITYHSSDVNAIYLLDGKTGTLKYTPNTLRIHSRNKGLAVGDADGDGRAEFYYITASDEGTGNSRKIACYEYNPAGINPGGSGTGTFDLQWTSSTQVTCGLSGGEEVAVEDFSVGLADFNYDGTPEVYVGNEIYNAITGQQITTGGTNSIGSWNHGEFSLSTTFHVMAVTTAIDVLPDNACANCSGLELVAGNQVYAVDITGGTMTVEQQAPNSLPDGNTAIADYDLDGDLDGIITTNDATKSYLYIWDLQTNTQIGGTHTVQTTSSLSYHPINLPIIADFDGDNRPEIGVCGHLVFQVVEDHLTDISGTGGTLWNITTTDVSGQTGAAVFDFNGDGVSEVVYRDEDSLRIMSGPTGVNLATFGCGSGTGGEYPVIADIDNDDETEIVCNCSASGTANTKAFRSNQYPWVSTRKLWNQYAYFNVNINDDLTIPQQQQSHHIVGSPANGTSGPLNSYLKQVSPLDKNGDLMFPAPDVSVVTGTNTTQCLTNGTVDLSMVISNSGDAITPSGMPISIYSSDPEGTVAVLMATTLTASSIGKGASITVNYTLDVSSLTFPTTIYIVVNDDGSIIRPYNLSSDFPSTSIGECNFSNNKEAVILNQGCSNEICNNGIDEDGDGLIDCADPDCKPIILSVTTVQPTCINKTSGQITITASGSGILSYSIKNETVWQSSNIFTNLGVGQYTIRVKNDSDCEVEYSSNPVILDFGTCLEICNDGIDNDGDGLIDCDDPDCDDVGGATGINNN